MPTAEVETDDGEAVTVNLDEHVPDGQRIVSEDEVVDREYHEKEISRVKDRFDSSMRSDVRQELKEDEAFRKEVAAEYDLDEDERKEVVQQVEEEKVEPLRSELKRYKERTKREKILGAARERGDIDPKALQSVGGADPLLLQALEDRVQETDDGRFVMADENGTPLPGEDGGYASISEGLDQLSEQDEFQPLFAESEPTRGSGFEESAPGSPQPSGWEEMSRDEVISYVEEHGHHPRMDG
jgi:hypothetical protein